MLHSMKNYLVEEYGHEEEIQQHGLWKSFVVKLEEEHSEDDCDVLVRRAAEGRAQQLQASDGDHQSTESIQRESTA